MSENFFSVVVGLGNPGAQYDTTRHNIGFAVIDALRACSGLRDASELKIAAQSHARDALTGSLGSTGWHSRNGFLEASCSIGDWSSHLIKPMTYMNRSGEPLSSFLQFRKISLAQVIVAHDEIDIPFGALRVKFDGGEGGHNGLRSISERCGGRGYARVRVGVGKPPTGSPQALKEDAIASWVLSRFTAEEHPYAEELVVSGVLAIYELATKGMRSAQNKFNK